MQWLHAARVNPHYDETRWWLNYHQDAFWFFESNRASERAFIKAGFVIEGKRPEHFLINGQAEGLTLMGMML